ncbi:hypothetical protein AMTRI_Chr11g100230 [Amborella trichopoda]|uniref:metal transporter Nramp5-like isoform X1 n=1 Tax=Amborella trichopoda TaxID=13333 RepID=UPI0009C00155|nr:metal transporter Nramp5-like isoform X1 [Amborella trichopoda]XP_020521411.1 metal transporter Nramp5-like isoform X1 [Amborella trichopoda]|eukprot:XP_020521410.1 metal transporter Nramp5-like isoform X1 [Amborella trichopoda]
MAYIGPGFLVSLAYLDPDNLETDLQAGASYQYELLWVVLIGLIFALIIQSFGANLGVTTGHRKRSSLGCLINDQMMATHWTHFQVGTCCGDSQCLTPYLTVM